MSVTPWVVLWVVLYTLSLGREGELSLEWVWIMN